MIKIAAQGDFVGVASIICAEPPQWLPVALAHYAVWIDDDDDSEVRLEVKKRIGQMQEAVRVLENSLPFWQHMPFDIACPPAVKTILGALPGLKKELDRLSQPRIGRRPDAQREICAAVIMEAWRIIHGKVEPRSEQLYRACNQYWVECGGASLSAKSDIEKWRWTVSQALKSDRSWISDRLMEISSTKWTDKKPQIV